MGSVTPRNYTLSDARGTGSTENEAISGLENVTNRPTIITPLDFNETHRGNLNLDYRFAEDDGGPILEAAVSYLRERLREVDFPSYEIVISENGSSDGTLVEAAKLAPQWDEGLRELRDRERSRGHTNRATLMVARKLVARLVDHTIA